MVVQFESLCLRQGVKDERFPSSPAIYYFLRCEAVRVICLRGLISLYFNSAGSNSTFAGMLLLLSER
jgi:hypothetical protein